MFTFFNHEQLRRYLVAFGSIFSHLEIRRMDADGVEVQRLVVPIEYGPKERWLTRLTQDPDFLQGVGQTLPRLSYEVSNISYDASRKLNNFDAFKFPNSSGTQITKMWVPVPYNVTFDLTILAKNQQDALQVVEQILPYFQPDFTFAMNVVPSVPSQVEQITMSLNSVTPADNYEGEFEKLRAITWTFNFTMKVYFYGPVKSAARIHEVIVNIYQPTIPGLDNLTHLTTEDRAILTLEDGSGHVVTENTANAFLTTGRIAQIDSVADLNQVQLPGPDVIANTTITES